MSGTRTTQDSAGEFWIRGGIWLGALFWNLFKTVAILVVGVGMVVPDLILGPQFMFAWSESQGVRLTGVATVIPWALTIAVSGFQTLLIRRLRYGGIRHASGVEKVAIAVAIGLAVIDTVVDVGGMTAWIYGPEQGANIVPDDVTPLWLLLAVLVVVICGLRELVLDPLLLQGAKGVRKPGTPGARLVEAAITVLGHLYGMERGIFLALTAVSVLALDLVLGPQFFTELGTGVVQHWGFDVLWWTISVFTTGTQVLIRRRYVQGGVRAAGRWTIIALGIGWALAAFDTMIDVAGLTAFMYGPEEGVHVVPRDVTLAWLLVALEIAILCGFFEWLLDGLQQPAELRKTATAEPGPVYDTD